ncbi:NAD(P)/FAD-dependent oxidoreductase [Chromobacterium sp. IIBBL 290-4]|uniref:FAD-dependent oxidoreductase n=1 Tax=Chromobacterium sp. IIBBL 290-4 TaxID=2953890 RepID=UPI0020B8A213|nr:FAD-dependent monooxygenase [Chromobacterium sp. IIBBL 290-4]UTH73735.1 FAD-dependent monooxygenase [Chromobacterium sp. IIBBL 290-4]
MNKAVLNVAIVGAGLGGLALAQALSRSGVACRVFERDAALDSRPQGYRIRIDTAGRSALAQCLAPEAYRLFLERCAQSAGEGRFFSPDLSAWPGAVPESWRPAHAETSDEDGDRRVHRQTLREILLGGIADQVRFDCAFQRVERVGSRLRLQFSNDETYVCDALVGADGAFSAVRRFFAPEADPPKTGAACLYGRAPLDGLHDPLISALQGPGVIFDQGFMMVLDPMRLAHPRAEPARRHAPDRALSAVEDYWYWALFTQSDRLSAETALAQAAAMTRHWHPAVCGMLEQASGATLAAIRCAEQVPTLPEPHAVLLGDAAHVMSPAGGLGANTALQDAASLARRLTAAACGESGLTQALSAYDQEMRARASRAMRLSREGEARVLAIAAHAGQARVGL